VRIISHPDGLDELTDALEAAECLPVRVAEDSLSVLHLSAIDEREAGIELSFFIKAWQVAHPDVVVEIQLSD
jgi:hypothetical protein